MSHKLLISDHSRDIAGLQYVYPVISRRAGGLSIGINVNINNACNWRCVYCQVPDLARGSPPAMDFSLLEKELRIFLDQVLHGNFFDQFNVPDSLRVIKDIAISGNGEPTSLEHFDKVVKLVGEVATEMGVLPASQFVLITNGSLINKLEVQAGLKTLDRYQGEVWFKLDSATEQGRKKINGCNQSADKTLSNLKMSASLCDTSLQTCMMDYLVDDENELERKEYIVFLKNINRQKVKLKKVMLYTLARPSLQPEAINLSKLDAVQMNKFAEEIKRLGYYDVSVSA